MWPFSHKQKQTEPGAPEPGHILCVTCAEASCPQRPGPARPAEPEPPQAAFAFDTTIGRVYAVEYVPEVVRESLEKLPGGSREYTRREVAGGRTTISYAVDRADGGWSMEFTAALTVEQHNEIVRQWLAGWRVLQWPRPADKLP